MQQSNGEPYLLLVGDHDRIFGDSIRLSTSARTALDGTPAFALTADVAGEGAEGAGADTEVRHTPAPSAAAAPGPFARIPDALFAFWGVPADPASVIRSLGEENALAGLIGQLPDDVVEPIIDYARDETITRPGTREEVAVTDVLLEARRARDAQELAREAGTPGRSEGAAPADGPKPAAAVRGTRSPLGLTRELLLTIGVPESLVGRVLAARGAEDIEDVPLPLRTGQLLLEAIAVPQVTAVPADQTADLWAADERDVEDYCRGDLKRLLLRLMPEQRAVVDLPAPDVHLVKGVAGSGKSTVALHRACRLLRERADARVLLVTFSSTLAAVARDLACELLRPEEAQRFTAVHLQQWMRDFLGQRGRRVRHLADAERATAIRAAIDEAGRRPGRPSRLLDRPAAWFLEEISHSIKGRGLGSLDEYLALDRSGRSTALNEAGRRLVWRVYEAYETARAGRLDWDDYPLACLEELEQSREGAEVDHVMVDEAQDLSPVALRLVLALARPDAPSLLVLADAAQSIYRAAFRWKDLGRPTTARVHQLRHNYRNTAEVLRTANAFLARHPELRDDGEAMTPAEHAVRRGPPPRVVYAAGARAEGEWIVQRIDALREAGVPYGNVAVLAPWRRRVRYLAWLLGEYGIPTVQRTDDAFAVGADAVKVLTLHAAKGLEFPVVFVADANAGVLPRAVPDGDADDVAEAGTSARRLLYVGMTRAMQELYVTATEGKASPLLAELECVVRVQDSPRSAPETRPGDGAYLWYTEGVWDGPRPSGPSPTRFAPQSVRCPDDGGWLIDATDAASELAPPQTATASQSGSAVRRFFAAIGNRSAREFRCEHHPQCSFMLSRHIPVPEVCPACGAGGARVGVDCFGEPTSHRGCLTCEVGWLAAEESAAAA